MMDANEVKKDDIFNILEHLKSISVQLANVLEQNAVLKAAASEASAIRSQIVEIQKQIDKFKLEITDNSEALGNLPCGKHAEALSKLLAAINDPEKGIIAKIKDLGSKLDNKIEDTEDRLAVRINKHEMYWSIVYWMITAPAGLGVLGALIYFLLNKAK